MLLDSEQQKSMLLQIIDAANINGPLNNIVNTVSALMQLRQDVQNAKVGDANACSCSDSAGCDRP
jgi:hypothetical protein